MKNNWKEEFKSIEITEKRLDCLLDRRFGVFRLENLEDFIESLLAKQKKELIEEIITMIPEHQKPITSKRYSEIVKNNPHTPKFVFFLGENIGRNGFRQSMYILLRKYAEDNGISLKHHD